MMIRVGLPAVVLLALGSTVAAVTPPMGTTRSDVLTVAPLGKRQNDLTITVPGTRSLLSGFAGGQISRTLTTVQVSDTRGGGDWVATVSATNFTTGGGTLAETIPSSDIFYWSGPATATTGPGTFTPGQLNAAAAQSLNVSRTAFTHTVAGAAGNNTASWNPTIVVHVPVTALPGTYTGTVNHSVA